jgi:hypothetical protein
MGCKLTEIDRYLERGPGSTGEVVEWLPGNKGQSSEPLFRNEYGTFFKRDLGSYDTWRADSRRLNAFTGTITFYHLGATSSDVNVLVFVGGALVKKDWGFLPG